jgi:hypothetical protein
VVRGHGLPSCLVETGSSPSPLIGALIRSGFGAGIVMRPAGQVPTLRAARPGMSRATSPPPRYRTIQRVEAPPGDPRDAWPGQVENPPTMPRDPRPSAPGWGAVLPSTGRPGGSAPAPCRTIDTTTTHRVPHQHQSAAHRGNAPGDDHRDEPAANGQTRSARRSKDLARFNTCPCAVDVAVHPVGRYPRPPAGRARPPPSPLRISQTNTGSADAQQGEQVWGRWRSVEEGRCPRPPRSPTAGSS